VLEEIGLRRLNIKHLIYVLLERHSKKLKGVSIGLDLVIAIYINNIIIISQTKAVINNFKMQLSRHFNIKDIREALNYLGIKIVWNRVTRTLKIYQTKYCESLLKKYRIAKCNLSNILIYVNTKIIVDNSDKALNSNSINCY